MARHGAGPGTWNEGDRQPWLNGGEAPTRGRERGRGRARVDGPNDDFGPGFGPWDPPPYRASGRMFLLSRTAPARRKPVRGAAPQGDTPNPKGNTMSNPILKASVNAKVWANTSVDRMKARADRGQGAVEYLGIIVVVVAIIAALLLTNIGAAIGGAITTKIGELTGGE
jgi:hypothetical protein